MASDELKPCPFCGGAPKVRTPEDFDGFAIHVHCRCGAQLYGGKRHFMSADEAATTWNRRAQDFDAMRQRVELLEGLLSTARDYVYSELEERKAAMAGYPHKWQQEEADLAEIDAALDKQP